MANIKKFYGYDTTAKTVYGIIERIVDNYRLNDADGTFAAAPADPYVSFTEHSVIKGEYGLSEARQTWNNGWYKCTMFEQAGGSPAPVSDMVIGYSLMYIRSDTEVANEADLSSITGKLPTNYIMGSSVQTDKDDEIDAILIDTNALNDTKIPDTLSLTNINTQCDTALTDYDPPTRTEATSDKDAIITYVDKIDDATDGLTAIKAEVEGLAGAAMRGTDNAALEANVVGHVTASLNSYDPPTRAELTTDKDSIIAEVDANEAKIDTVAGYIDTEVTTIINAIAALQTDLGDPSTDITTIYAQILAVKGYVDDLEIRLSATRAGYLDNLSGGAVALDSTVAKEATLANVTYGLSALKDLIDAIDTSTELTAKFTEIKGAGWTDETLKAIKDAIGSGGISAADVWAYTTRALTDKSDFGLTSAYDSAKAAASQTSVDAIPTNPLLTNDVRLDNIDATISSRSTLDAAGVWSYGTRTLSSFGTLVSDVATAVWVAGTRTLTSIGSIVSDIWSYVTRSLTDKDGFAPTVGEIDTQLSTTHGAGVWGSASSYILPIDIANAKSNVLYNEIYKTLTRGDSVLFTFVLNQDCSGWTPYFGIKKNIYDNAYLLEPKELTWVNDDIGSATIPLNTTETDLIGECVGEVELRNGTDRITVLRYYLTFVKDVVV